MSLYGSAFRVQSLGDRVAILGSLGLRFVWFMGLGGEGLGFGIGGCMVSWFRRGKRAWVGDVLARNERHRDAPLPHAQHLAARQTLQDECNFVKLMTNQTVLNL